MQVRITTVMETVFLANQAETLALGARLAGILQPGDIVALTGDLGAGKTTLARGCIMAKTGAQEVPSPTYTLVQTYDAKDMEIWHCDLYRLENPNDAYELGLIDAFEDMTCLIEWPERLGTLLPEDRLTIHISFSDEGRMAALTGGPSWTERIAKLHA